MTDIRSLVVSSVIAARHSSHLFRDGPNRPFHGGFVILVLACWASPLKASVYYESKIVAKTGDLGITEIDPHPSINDEGIVAFLARLPEPGTGITIENVFVGRGDPNTLVNVLTSINSAVNQTVIPGCQINNAGRIVVRRFQQIPSPLGPIPVTLIETWNAHTVNDRALLVYGEPLFGAFDSLYAFPSIPETPRRASRGRSSRTPSIGRRCGRRCWLGLS